MTRHPRHQAWSRGARLGAYRTEDDAIRAVESLAAPLPVVSPDVGRGVASFGNAVVAILIVGGIVAALYWEVFFE